MNDLSRPGHLSFPASRVIEGDRVAERGIVVRKELLYVNGLPYRVFLEFRDGSHRSYLASTLLEVEPGDDH